ncbi:probable cysteine--tRNA ligase, mitochondrial, partial [Chiloscyllium plagiosum]|uniref:probable cysteine--tRNA ligase, mitochondrial n=1 Tax=Chiloscyllium plagiosum TaxID=36176 RepID=UPI001CB86C68
MSRPCLCRLVPTLRWWCSFSPPTPPGTMRALLACRSLPAWLSGCTFRVCGRQPGGRCSSSWHKPKGHPAGVQVYNSLTRNKEPLVLAEPVTASCSYVRFDILRRILTKIFGIDVIMVMVITDIDDKIIKRANELNISSTVLSRIYEEDFKQDMACLKVLPPTIYMRVTDNIPKIVAFIERIIHNGHAYSTST